MAHHQYGLMAATLNQQFFEERKGGCRRQRVRQQNLLLVAGLRTHQRGRLQAALQRTGDDQIEAHVHGCERVSQKQAVALAGLIQRTADIQQGITAARAGRRVS